MAGNRSGFVTETANRGSLDEDELAEADAACGGIASNCSAIGFAAKASAIPPLSTPVLGYVLFAERRIDTAAQKLSREQASRPRSTLGALSIQL
jgi:hypothetical protein